MSDDIHDFVLLTEGASYTYLSVNADSGADNFVNILGPNGVTGLGGAEALEAAGTLTTV